MKRILLILMMFIFTYNNAFADDSFKNCDFIIYNKCINCEAPLSFQVGTDEECTTKCPNREVNNEGTGSSYFPRNCALKECPKDKPYRNYNKGCVETTEEPKYKNYSEQFKKEPVDNVCPEDSPLPVWGNKCVACDAPVGFKTSEEDCKKCPNRIYNDGYCYIPCPKDKPLLGWDLQCHSCDTPTLVSVDSKCNSKKNCDNVCPNRIVIKDMGGNPPSVIRCPKEKPLIDYEGMCHSCDEASDINLRFNTTFCAESCPTTRHLDGDICRLNSKRRTYVKDILNPNNPLKTDEEYVGEYEAYFNPEGIAFSIKLEDGEFRLKFYSPIDDYNSLEGDEFLCKKDRIIRTTSSSKTVDYFYLDCKLVSSEKGHTRVPYMYMDFQKGSKGISIGVFRVNKEDYFRYDCDDNRNRFNCPVRYSGWHIKKEGE